MIIYHNLAALNTYNRLYSNQASQAKSLEKLSSGLRINRAADDAAGLAISEKMRAQIRGLDQATRNAQDGISMIQTAEGGLSETHSILQRMRELSVQAANDTYTSSDRMEIQKEVDQLKDEITRIANTTQFNNKNLLDGSTSALVSTDNLSTKVYMKGELRVLDQFGQKAAGGGNYKLHIEAVAGQAEVQKTDLMRIKHSGQKTVQDQNIGYSRMDIHVSGAAGATSGNVTLSLEADGVMYEVKADITTASMTGMMDGMYNALTNDMAINGKFSVVKDMENAILTIERKDAPEKTFSFTWKRDVAAGLSGNFGANLKVMHTGVASSNATFFNYTLTGGSSAYFTADASKQNISNLIATSTTTLVAGNYTIDTNAVASGILTTVPTLSGTVQTVQSYLQNTTASATSILTFSFSAGSTTLSGVRANQSMVWEVYNKQSGSVTFKVSYVEMTKAGTGMATANITYVTLAAGVSGASFTSGGLEIGSNTYFSGSVHLTTGSDVRLTVGDKFVLNAFGITGAVSGGLSAADTVVVTNVVTANGSLISAFSTTTVFAVNDNALVGDKAVNFAFFQIDVDKSSDTYGQAVLQNIQMDFANTAFRDTSAGMLQPAAAFTVKAGSRVGELATLDTKLYDIEKFWDSSGNFILDNPATVSLVQGDGTTTEVTLYGSDTIQNVVDKLNDAIGNGLGQGDIYDVAGDSDKFVSYVTTAASTGLEAVQGTFVIRSAVTGKDGTITFTGDDAVLNALSLSTIQKTSENKFKVDVTEAHTGKVIAEDYQLEGNILVGIVDKNIDVEFDSNAGTKVTWNTATRTFDFGSIASGTDTFIHIADRSTVFQVGANSMQDIAMGVGNMTADALGIDNIQVTSNTLANNAIKVLDKAISEVSSERAKLGALQNRLDHTITNLSTTSENLTAAESRIRDVDMAKEMMSFTRWQILSNAATSMLGQANQIPQGVLQLLRS